jgi:hypothetical protein
MVEGWRRCLVGGQYWVFAAVWVSPGFGPNAHAHSSHWAQGKCLVTFHGTLQRRLVTRDVGIPNERKVGHLEVIRRNFSVLAGHKGGTFHGQTTAIPTNERNST